MADRKERKRKLALYESYPHYEFVDKIVRQRVSLELEEMAEHPSLSGDMQWALRHASKMILSKEE
jgi:hypothetical protein